MVHANILIMDHVYLRSSLRCDPTATSLLVTTSKALVTTSVAPVTTSVALVTTSVSCCIDHRGKDGNTERRRQKERTSREWESQKQSACMVQMSLMIS